MLFELFEIDHRLESGYGIYSFFIRVVPDGLLFCYLYFQFPKILILKQNGGIQILRSFAYALSSYLLPSISENLQLREAA